MPFVVHNPRSARRRQRLYRKHLSISRLFNPIVLRPLQAIAYGHRLRNRGVNALTFAVLRIDLNEITVWCF